MKIFGILLITSCFILPVFTQESGENILKTVQEKYNTISDVSADFTQVISGGKSAKGKFFFKKEQKLRIEFNNLTIITDGQTTWNFNKRENKVIISSYDDSDPFALSLNKLIYDYPENSIVKDISKPDQKILSLTPKSATSNFKNISIWIDKNNLITRVIFEDLTSNKTDVTISGYKLNSNLTDSKFSFTAPEGSTVIDLR
ncbi:MAG: outer membrane lipoprotein carrier protein LolA [Ignavibacteriales bacterium]|nr:MAG: outer membrane lipoprotein carrier protein LolA [Ignavibacteriales bacterium]